MKPTNLPFLITLNNNSYFNFLNREDENDGKKSHPSIHKKDQSNKLCCDN